MKNGVKMSKLNLKNIIIILLVTLMFLGLNNKYRFEAPEL